MRPTILRLISTPPNYLQVKYFDDATAAVAVNLKTQLSPDPILRPRPLTWYEKEGLILPKNENELQSHLLRFQEFADHNNLAINQEKSKVMLFNFSHKYVFPAELELSQNVNLDLASECKILGVIISSDLKWAKNTEYITLKAMKRIWSIRRLKKLGLGDDFLIEVYKKEIRTLLEYAVQIWNGALTQKDSEKIEKVQKIVLRLLLRHEYTSYTEACKKFGLEKLSTRRNLLCVKFVKKEFKNSTGVFTKLESQKRRKVSKKNFVHEPKTRTQRHYTSCYAYLSRLLNNELTLNSS